MQETNQYYKSLIRIYKNIEAKLIDNTDIPDSFISSHYVESLLYNLPNHIFSGSYSDIVHNSLNWFLDNEFDDFKFQHNLFNLFGEGIDQWSISEANAFISAVVKFWNEW